MINKNQILDQLDSHVKSRYNVSEIDQVGSVEVDNKIIFFKNGLALVEFNIGFEMTDAGPRVLIGEFDLRDKLKE